MGGIRSSCCLQFRLFPTLRVRELKTPPPADAPIGKRKAPWKAPDIARNYSLIFSI
jgi:hypothetical protein